MRFRRQINTIGQLEYAVELQEYDATPPVSSLLIDAEPKNLSADREALALYLAFGRWCGGSLQIPRWLSPHTADTIATDFSPGRINIGPVEYYPKALPIGSQLITVAFEAGELARDRFLVLRTDQWNGAILGISGMAVASNAFLLAGGDKDIRPWLAVAALFAEDLRADTICIDQPGIATAEASALQELCASVRLGLKFQ